MSVPKMEGWTMINPKAPMPSQRAREAAADMHLEIMGSPHSESDLFEAEGLRAGDLDNWPEVQAFARFERDVAERMRAKNQRLSKALKRIASGDVPDCHLSGAMTIALAALSNGGSDEE